MKTDAFLVNLPEPLASPKNLIAISKLAPDKVHLQWESVPDIDVAGVRRGYTVTYRKTKDAGEYVDGDEKIVHIFDPLQTEIVIEGLEYYSRYSFAIRVFNTMFYGDNSHKVYAGKDKIFLASFNNDTAHSLSLKIFLPQEFPS
jgi:hypothetical protein